MNWYYALDNQRHGPVSENEFDYLVHLKKIGPDTLVWNEGMSDWRPFRELQPDPVVPPPLPTGFAEQPPAQAPPERNGPAWEHRDSIGGLKAALKTVLELLGSRGRAFANMKLTADWPGPFCFALFLGGIGFYASLVYFIIYTRLDRSLLQGNAAMLGTNAGAVLILAFAFFFIPLLISLLIALNSVIIHGCLMIFGEAKHPFETTYRVVSYSLGASSVFQFIPIIGGVLSFASNLVLMINGIARTHEVTQGKAALCMVPIILYTGFFWLLSVM